MSLPILITSVATGAFAITLILLLRQKGNSNQLERIHSLKEKNRQYLLVLLKEIEDGAEYARALEKTVEIISKSLEKNYPYSTLSSIFIKDEKLVFSSQVKEVVSNAFVSHIKDTMLSSLTIPTDTHPETDEKITGVTLDDLGASTIKSTFDIKLSINSQIAAVINISSINENLYSEEDRATLNSLSELVSSFLTRLDYLLTLEKSKSLAMIDSFSEGIFMIDQGDKLSAMNDSAQDILSIHKKTPTIRDVLSALPNTYNFKDKIDQVMNQKKMLTQNDVPIRNKIFDIVITPVMEIHTENPKTIGVSVLLHDITLEKSLAQMKEDFTNIMVHELRSPLTAIKASSEFLESQADLTEDEKKKLIGMVSDSSRKMLDKISLILDSAKMDAGLFSIRKTESDLKKLIIDRITVFTPVASEKHIVLTVDMDPNLAVFSFDPIRIDEVVNNLLSNSLKFTPEGGSIHIKVETAQDSVTVGVTDTGAGIPKDKQHLLFSKFQQAPTDGAHQGTGLGLYVVKGVVEEHGGKVTLVSEPGHGTTISFTLPYNSYATPNPHISAEHTKLPNPMSN